MTAPITETVPAGDAEVEALRELIDRVHDFGVFAIDGDDPTMAWDISVVPALVAARASLARLTASSPPARAATGAVEDDVARLVVAARTFAHSDPFPEDKTELDQALEAFAERVRWGDQPEDESAEALSPQPGQAGKEPGAAERAGS